jgi:hypothetical protein
MLGIDQTTTKDYGISKSVSGDSTPRAVTPGKRSLLDVD